MHRILLTFLLVLTGLATTWPLAAQVTLTELTLDTPRQQVTLEPTGLPAQWRIKPTPAEIPRPLRSKEYAETELQAIGRGPLWRAPLQLVAVIGGQPFTFEAPQAAQPVLAEGVVTCETPVRAGALEATLKVRYADDGSLLLELRYGGQDLVIEQLDLVLELAGDWDTAIAGAPLAATHQATAANPCTLAAGEGLAWSNLPDAALGLTVNQPGVLGHFFLGSGDRGLTWLTGGGPGFAIDPKLPTITVTRDKTGQLTMRSRLVNTPTPAKTARTLSLALLVHPSQSRPADFRRTAWQPWTGSPATPALTWAARQPGAAQVIRADHGTVHEAGAARLWLTGPAGGDAVSAQATLADSYPIALYRYLAGTHTGLLGQVRPNAATLAPAGTAPGNDQMVLGRALLHDLGVALPGLGNQRQAARVLQVLDEFGYFLDDGQTEFIPYWRSRELIRYGETHVAGDAFALNTTDPMARALISIYTRPSAKDPKKTQALMVVVNESDQPMREQFYLLKPERLFGGPNKVSAAGIINRWDFTGIPADSDWRKEQMISSAVNGADRLKEQLLDLMDGGLVRGVTRAEGVEIYGFLHVPPRSFRLIYGAGAF